MKSNWKWVNNSRNTNNPPFLALVTSAQSCCHLLRLILLRIYTAAFTQSQASWQSDSERGFVWHYGRCGGQLTVAPQGLKPRQASSCSLSSELSPPQIILLDYYTKGQQAEGDLRAQIHRSCETRSLLLELFVSLFDPVCCFKFLRLVTTGECSQQPRWAGSAAPSWHTRRICCLSQSREGRYLYLPVSLVFFFFFSNTKLSWESPQLMSKLLFVPLKLSWRARS